MLKMNIGIWIGIICGVLGLIIGVVVPVITGGKEGLTISLIVLVTVGSLFYFFYTKLIKPIMTTSRLQKTGIPARAKILEVTDTGVTINESPQVKIKLEVKRSHGPKYITETRSLVSRLNPGAFQAGMEIPVKIDPKNEMVVVIDYSGEATVSSNQPNEAAIQAQIMKEQDEGQVISATGKSARAIIKKHTWLGVNVNGKNPYVELELEILPENSVSFSGKAKGVIAEASVSKYQPGEEIYVKYDHYDNSKIVIDHS